MGPASRLAAIALGAFLVASALPGAARGGGDVERLSFWNVFTSGDLREGLIPLVEEYDRARPDVEVETLDVATIEDKLLMTIAGGAPPDVVLFDRFRIAQFAHLGAFMPLEEQAAADGVHREDFFAATWDECAYEGHLWAIPFNTDVRVLFWNKALFREAGLDRPPRTWKELEEWSPRLTHPADKSQPLRQVGFVPVFGNTFVYLFAWQMGATFEGPDGRIRVDEPQTVESLEWMKRLVDWYGVERIRRLEEGFGVDAMNPFVAGKQAMLIDEVSLMSSIRRYRPDLEYDVAPLPYPEGGVHASAAGGFALAIPRGARNPRAAWAFIRHLTAKETQTKFGMAANGLPANRRATEVPYFADDPQWRVFIAEMDVARYRPRSPVGGVAWEALGQARDYVTYGVKQPAAALAEAQARVAEAQDALERSGTLPLVDWRRTWLLVGTVVAGLLGTRLWVSWRRCRRDSIMRRESRTAYLMAAPAIIGFAVFSAGPILASLVLCFTWYDVLNPARVAGLANFTRMFTGDDLFGRVVWNTLVFTAMVVPTGLVLALAAALLVNEPLKGRGFFRSVFFLPVVTPVIAASLLWMWLLNAEYGIVNALLGPLVNSAPARWLCDGATLVLRGLSVLAPGLADVRIEPRLPNWLNDPFWAKPAIVIMTVWGFGQAMVIFLAGLQRIPEGVYEAATIDGASWWQKLRYVTLPLLSPTIFFNLVIGLIGALQVFTQIFVATYGGPVDSTRFYVLHIYREAFINLRMGYASALAWVLFVIILALTAAQFRIARRWVHYE